MSLRSDSKSPGLSRKASKAVGPTPTKRRNSTLWSETLDVHQKSTFSAKEIKRQEVGMFICFYSLCSELKSTESWKKNLCYGLSFNISLPGNL